MTTLVLEIAAAVLILVGAAAVATGARSLFAERDAVSRINSFGIVTSMGLPLVALGAMLGRFVVDGFSWAILLKSFGAMLAFILVSSVASNALARAAYMSGAPLDPRTAPNDLVEEPRGTD